MARPRSEGSTGSAGSTGGPTGSGTGSGTRSGARAAAAPAAKDGATGSIPAPRAGGRAEARKAAQSQGRGGRGGQGGDGGQGGGSGHRRSGGRGKKPERNVKKIVGWTAVGALVLIAGTGGAIYFKLSGNIKTFDSDAVSKDRPPEATADANGNKPVNILLIGSDSRGGGNSDLGGGNSEGARSDTTILLHVYADHKNAIGVSIPRNTLAVIPPCKLPNGKWTKEQKGDDVLFNAAFETGGSPEGNPACTQNTVEKLTGIRVDHTIVVDFSGFSSMTKAVGGVEVCLPKAIYEGDINPNLNKKGAQVLPVGKQKVDGQKALDYVRLRHGIGDGSDIGRMKRQQAFMSSMISTVKKQGLDPTTLLPLADAATKSLRVDEGLNSVDKLMSLALSLKGIDMHDLKFVTPPWRYHGANLDLVKPDADKLWEAIRADHTLDGKDATGQQPDAPAAAPETPAVPTPAAPTTTAPPTTAAVTTPVKVAVYNGTTVNGLAGKASEALKAAKFTVTGTMTAKSTNKATTTIEYGAGQKANAEKVAALFPGATLAASSAAGISVVLGKDYADANGGAAASGAPAATPTAPAPLPTSVTEEARSADDDICANTTYGSGG
ncbi:LCP family protein [Streptomyces sp. BE303]|uniref:LCP family protein n=1 Tax=Streptomyces sp. BE303 TaxID=3002528 RepID=UPI002E762399|nr:LCP family protein [Streptomyces sp. BE303]MED7951612.1 LCP family protein [Streptomyces sp. BE303]